MFPSADLTSDEPLLSGRFSSPLVLSPEPFLGGTLFSFSDIAVIVEYGSSPSLDLSLDGLRGVSPSFDFRKPPKGPERPTFSTAMKLARTLESGLPLPELSEPAGERPREGGEVLSFWLWFSNFASRLRTPPADGVPDMAGSEIEADEGRCCVRGARAWIGGRTASA